MVIASVRIPEGAADEFRYPDPKDLRRRRHARTNVSTFYPSQPAPRPMAADMGHCYSGEWFKIDETLDDYMLDSLPPLWMRGPIFALREFLTGSITSCISGRGCTSACGLSFKVRT